MPPEDEKTPLERLEERIYQPKETETAQVPAYSDRAVQQAYGWTPPPPPPPPKPRMPWTTKFLIGTGIFFVLAGGVAAFLVLYGARTVSADHVQITVLEHPAIASGDTVPLVITIHNGNPTSINDAIIYAMLPSGTRAGDGSDAPFEQYSDSLGTIAPGTDVTRTIQAKFFGTEGQAFSVPIRVEYHTNGSNAVSVARDDYELTISTSPLQVQVSTLSQSASGQPLTLSVSVRSSASAPLSGVAVLADYPPGFLVTSATPTPLSNGFFVLGDLAPGEEKVIKVTGTLTGTQNDEKVFHFTSGSKNPDGTSTLGLTYAQGSASVTLTRPFLATSLSLNREAADTVIVSPGDPINAMLTWQNSLTVPITNAAIQIGLSGNAIDPSGISGGTGFYRSSDSSIIFSKDTNSGLAMLQGGDTGAGSFTLHAKSVSQLAGVKNPNITLTVSATGARAQEGNVPQTLTSTLTRTIKVSTTVDLAAKLAKVSGPVPPTAGTETIYGVNWTAHNTLNSVGGARVSVALPAYVRFVTGSGGSSVTYDETSRTVTWNVGDLAPGAASASMFQVALLPSASQSGTSPIVIGIQSFSGVDRFTQGTVSATAPALTSELPGISGSGVVH
ncbi:MAG: hypothetical protein V4480_01210 [Patescibacteria group bacterium]